MSIINLSALAESIQALGNSISSNRLSTAPLQESELAAIAGQSFESAVVFTLGSTDTKYLCFSVPTTTEQFIALQTRLFKADLPDVDLEILWDAEVSGGTALPIFNNHDALSLTAISTFLEDPTVDETDSVVREQDFIPSGGSGNKSGGQIGDNNAYRIYRSGESFVVKITNNANTTNKIKIGYAWLEPNVALLGTTDWLINGSQLLLNGNTVVTGA